uniref:Uncharacterized protein n=1 Tax=viral metagenome TaxID=1070528 RepID=A0A6M3JLZ0_9ZZZZ
MFYSPNSVTLKHIEDQTITLLGNVKHFLIILNSLPIGSVNIYERGGASIDLTTPINFQTYKEISDQISSMVTKEFKQIDEWRYN